MRSDSRKRAFKSEQPAFGVEPRSAAIAAQAAVARDHAMAWDDDRDRISSEGLAHGPAGLWPADFPRETMVSPNAPGRDAAGGIEDAALKRRERGKIQIQVKMRARAGKIFPQLRHRLSCGLWILLHSRLGIETLEELGFAAAEFHGAQTLLADADKQPAQG